MVPRDEGVMRRMKAPARSRRNRQRRSLVSSRHYLLPALATALFFPAGLAALLSIRRAHGLARTDPAAARAELAKGRTRAWFGVSMSVLLSALAAVYLVFASNHQAVFFTFFAPDVLRENFPYILGGFLVNVELFLVCEVLILGWSLVVAVVRELPGPAARPVRLLAIVYTDVFRVLPSLLILLIIGLGLQRTGLPVLSHMTDFQAAVLALTLNYGAYVSEIVRAGLHSVHWSQAAAARSLGLTYTQALRLVVLPQAVRHIIPPLLNSFISLQKDSSLVTILGVLDSVNRAQAVSSYTASLAPYSGVAFCFLVITVPLTRLTDYLTARYRKAVLARS